MYKRLLFLLWMTGIVSQAFADDGLTVTSPDGHISVSFALNDNVPTYTVRRDGKTIIAPSRLGFAQRRLFTNGVVESKIVEIDETYTLPHGKVSTYRNHCNELTVSLDNPGDADVDIVFRAYNDAVAFRYAIPTRAQITTFADELTEFNFTQFNNALVMDYTHDYSTYYHNHAWAGLNNGDGYSEPMLVDMGDNGYALLTEADQTESTAGSKIVKGGETNQLKLELCGTSNIRNFPFATPWRTLILGDLNTIVESTAITNLCPPSIIEDTSWIKPSCVTWNWGGEDMDGNASESFWKRYVDFAAHLGWKYCLIDDGWKNNLNMSAFVNYCKTKNVEPILWLHQRDFQNNYGDIYNKMLEFSRQGIKGLKIDFFDGDSQEMMQKYMYMLKASAYVKMMLDFHGCTRPTGWERTYPHLMTWEAVFGGEMNLDWHHMIPADHQANLVATRNVIGPMDFTPGKIAEKTGKIFTYNSWCNSIATMIVFESGFQCLTDCPENIIYSVVDPLYRQLPAGWDDIKSLEVAPGRYATVARRSGANWYVGSVSADNRVAQMDLSFLHPDSTYYAYIYQEGDCRYNIDFELREGVKSTDVMRIPVTKNGGAVVVLSTSDKLPKPEGDTYEAEQYATHGGVARSDNECSGHKYLSGISRNTRAVITRVMAEVDGEYAVNIYYKLENNNTAYVQVGNGGEKNYYTFQTLADIDNSRGYHWAMKTVYVNLKAGRNIIYYGNENGVAPSLDKIIVTPTLETQQVIAGVERVQIGEETSTNNANLRMEGASVVCEVFSPGTLDIYTLDGRLVFSTNIPAGYSKTPVPAHGAVIASVSTGQQGFARKMIFK